MNSDSPFYFLLKIMLVFGISFDFRSDRRQSIDRLLREFLDDRFTLTGEQV